jgi:hypothetical protein
VDALRVPGGLYVRRYARGLVAVNPDAGAHTLAAPAGSKLVIPVGGGALDAAASTRGWGLRERPVSGSVVVQPHGGVVVLQ